MKLLLILRYLGLAVTCYILFLAVTYGISVYQLLYTLLTGAFICLGVKIIHVLYAKYGATQVLLALLIAGGVIRFFWAVYIPTLPVSDFKNFHENSIKLSEGIAILTKNMGYTLFLSTMYRISPGVLTGKLINAAASTLSILLIHLIGSKLASKTTGLIAAFIFTILPSEIMMVSVLGTEVMATTLGLAAAFFLFSLANNRGGISITSTFLAGLFYGFNLIVRPSFYFYLPAIMLWILLVSSFNIKQIVKTLGVLAIGITTGFGMIVINYSLIAGRLSFEPLGTQNSLPFIMGSNFESTGQYNEDDASLYRSWPAEERNARARQVAFDRITSNPGKFLQLVPKKMAILMGPNDYGVWWSINAIDWGEGNAFGVYSVDGNTWEEFKDQRDSIIKVSSLVSQSIYIVIWLFALIAFKNSRNNSLLLIVLVLLLSTILPHTILEVQSRYHHYIMPFIILLAANRVASNNDPVLSYNTNRAL